MSGAVAVAVARARKDIVRHFTNAKATSPDRAIAYDPDAQGWPRKRLRRRIFRRMVDFGAIREMKPGLFYLDFYLDETRLDEFRWHMRRRALGIVAIAGAAVAAIAALA